MKSFFLSLALLCSFLSSALASHYAGADIRYEYTGTGNVYKVYLTIYKRCEPGSTNLSQTETVKTTSVNNNVNLSRAINKISEDTLFGTLCPGLSAINSCVVTGSPWPGVIMAVYTDTFTMTPATDWHISWLNSARSSSTLNLANPGGLNIYVEAFLNNAASINSSAWMVNRPQLVIGVNGLNTSPFNTIDYDGDSVAYEFYTPETNPGVAAPYSSGYTLASPMGGVTQIVGNTLQLSTPLTGNFALAIRVKEYRNGVLVGYSNRDWSTYAINAPAVSVPVAQPGSTLQVVTCPGQSHSINLTFSNGVATDPHMAQVLPINNGIPVAPSSSIGTGSVILNVSWTTPATLNPATTPHFYIPIMVTSGACPNNSPMQGLTYYAIEVLTSQCNTDSVWAGDANGDNTVNVYDPLAIAIAYGSTGSPRSAISTTWLAQYCSNWTTSFANIVNMKHADCNGDGTVDNTDLTAVTNNWGQTHPKEGYSGPLPKVTGNPDLYFDLTGITLSPGATVSIPVKLGSASAMMNNFYGLATHIKIDGLNLASAPVVSYSSSWPGNSSNTLSFTKNIASTNVAWAYAKNDHQNINGSGTVATLQLTVPANAAIGQQVILSFQNSKIIDKNGAEITAVNILSDTGYVKFPTSVGTVQTASFNIQVIPNPSSNNAILTINTADRQVISIRITDITGRVVWTENKTLNVGTSEIKLPAQMLSAGLYIIDAGTTNGEQQRLKWIKQ